MGTQIGWRVKILRDLADEERDDPESMARGRGRALLEAANLLEDLPMAETDIVP